MLIILGSEESAAFQGNPHYPQVIRFDSVFQGPIHVVLVRGFGLALNPELLVVLTIHGNRPPRKRDRLHAGRRAELGVKFPEGGPNRVRACLFHCRRKGKPERQHVVWIKARIDAPEPCQGAGHEPGANQQNQRRGHLDHYE